MKPIDRVRCRATALGAAFAVLEAAALDVTANYDDLTDDEESAARAELMFLAIRMHDRWARAQRRLTHMQLRAYSLSAAQEQGREKEIPPPPLTQPDHGISMHIG